MSNSTNRNWTATAAETFAAVFVVAVTVILAFFAWPYWYMEVPPISNAALERIPNGATRAGIEKILGQELYDQGGHVLMFKSSGHWKVVMFQMNEDGTLNHWYIDD